MINDLTKASTTPLRLAVMVAFVSLLSLTTFGQTNATLRGTVTLGESGQPIHNVLITIMQLKRTVGTDEQGNYEFKNLTPGRYEVLAHLDRVPDIVQTVGVTAGATATLDFRVELGGVSEQVTVTASGIEQALSSSIQSVEVIGSIDLAKKSSVSLGEALDGELGVSKRSFGPAQRGLLFAALMVTVYLFCRMETGLGAWVSNRAITPSRSMS